MERLSNVGICDCQETENEEECDVEDCSRDDAFASDRTRRVAQIIEVPDQQGLTEELNNIRLALSSTQPMDPYPYLKAGVRVVVRSGPLQGMTGYVESRRQLDRLILKVEVLGQACSLEVDGAILDVLD